MKKLITLTFIIVYALSYAQNDAGKTGLSFLKIGVGAGESALAEAISTNLNSPFSIYYNPALLSFHENPNIGFMHNEWIQDVKSEFLISNFELFNIPLFAVVNSTNISEIEIRTKPGEKEGSFNAHYLNIGLGTALKLYENISTGVVFKYLYENIFDYEASGYALDLGLFYKDFYSDLNLGLTLRNLGNMSNLNKESTKLPTEIRIGASYVDLLKFSEFSFTPSIEFQKYFSKAGFPILFGLETNYSRMFFVRLGYRTGRELHGFSAGVGINWKGIQADYAYVPFKESFGSANIFSIFISL